MAHQQPGEVRESHAGQGENRSDRPAAEMEDMVGQEVQPLVRRAGGAAVDEAAAEDSMDRDNHNPSRREEDPQEAGEAPREAGVELEEAVPQNINLASRRSTPARTQK